MSENTIFDLIKRKIKRVEESGAIETYMIVGLGNPGKEYAGNRHNVGFMAIDHLMASLNFTGKKVKNKAIISEGLVLGRRIFLVKPQTFMNLSGDSVAALMHFYKLQNSDLLVIHDDIDLPYGTIRIRPSGGAGGQKGVASIIQKLGSPDFIRLRIGVGRPPGRMEAAAYVLRDFNKLEREELPFVMNSIEKAVQAYIYEGIESAMNNFNGLVNKDA